MVTTALHPLPNLIIMHGKIEHVLGLKNCLGQYHYHGSGEKKMADYHVWDYSVESGWTNMILLEVPPLHTCRDMNREIQFFLPRSS